MKKMWEIKAAVNELYIMQIIRAKLKFSSVVIMLMKVPHKLIEVPGSVVILFMFP